MEDNQPKLKTFDDMITFNEQEKTNIPPEQGNLNPEMESESKEKEEEEDRGKDIPISQTIFESNTNSDAKQDEAQRSQLDNKEPQQTTTTEAILIDEIKNAEEEVNEVITDVKEEEEQQHNNPSLQEVIEKEEPKPNELNDNDKQSNDIATPIQEATIKEIEPNEEQSNENEIKTESIMPKGTEEQSKDKEIIKLESAVIIEEEKEEETEPKPKPEKSKAKPKEKQIDFYKPKLTAATNKKLIPPKPKSTRNHNKSESYNSHNLSAMNSLQTSPKAPRAKKGWLSSKAKDQDDPHKQLNSTTIQIEDRPEISSTIAKAPNVKKEDQFNSTYLRFQEKIKEKGDKIANLRRKIEEKERNGLTGIPKINKRKVTQNDSDFLSRQKAYEQKVKEKKDKLATEAKSKIDKELNIVSSQSKANKEDLNHSLIHFKEWDEKKKQKINEMKTELEKKAVAEMNNGKIHKGAKCNIDDSCKRLSQDDVKKRQETKQMLQTMFKPAFKPTINSGKKKIQKDNKEINSDKGKYKGFDRKKENKESSSEKINTQDNDSANIIEEESKIMITTTTEFLTESNTDALREKLFRNRQKFTVKQSAMNQSAKGGTESFCLDTD